MDDPERSAAWQALPENSETPPSVKIDKCRLVPATMGIMTLGAGDLFIDDVSLVRPEALITEDAPSFMAGIAEFIGPLTFRPLCADVPMLQDYYIQILRILREKLNGSAEVSQ